MTVTNIVSDKVQLKKMIAQGQAAIGRDDTEVCADRGYFSGAEILASEKLGAITYVLKPYTSVSRAAGLQPSKLLKSRIQLSQTFRSVPTYRPGQE